jgi:hypothetical protein
MHEGNSVSIQSWWENRWVKVWRHAEITTSKSIFDRAKRGSQVSSVASRRGRVQGWHAILHRHEAHSKSNASGYTREPAGVKSWDSVSKQVLKTKTPFPPARSNTPYLSLRWLPKWGSCQFTTIHPAISHLSVVTGGKTSAYVINVPCDLAARL